MAITNIEVLKTRLAQAEEAYHKLMIGEKEVSVSVGSFGSTTYNQARRPLKATSALLNRKLPRLKAHQHAAAGL